MRSFATIFVPTLRELLRTRITVLPVVLLAFALMAGFAIDASGPTAADTDAVGASVVESLALLALLVAAAAGCGVISEEIVHGTVLLLGVRPVSRITVVLAKAAAAWVYAAAFLLVWSVVLGVVLAARGFGADAAWTVVQAGALRTPAVALIVGVAVFGSVLLGTRMAFGFTVLAWLVGWFSGQALQLFRGGEPIVEQLVPGLEPLVNAMTYVVPIRRLDDWAANVAGTLASGLRSPSGTELPTLYGGPGDLTVGLVATIAWVAGAAIAFRMRRSLV